MEEQYTTIEEAELNEALELVAKALERGLVQVQHESQAEWETAQMWYSRRRAKPAVEPRGEVWFNVYRTSTGMKHREGPFDSEREAVAKAEAYVIHGADKKYYVGPVCFREVAPEFVYYG
jgi:hypothetical protein